MNDLNNETKHDEERMIKFNNMEKIDDFFGSPAKFEKIFDPKKVTEAFAGGKKLDDWLDQATLDKLLASSPKEMRPTFTQWDAKGITADGLLATLKVNDAVKHKYSKVQQMYTLFLKLKPPQAAH
ncbi:hypothetical protein PF005_g16738 [Phytophthora fragariae]|uniref:Uncharacterized protein n=1 Tax=Phytophthora fragariae TaxID=53985 RepID=A0A6A4D1C8_9STRA|nr:hypothetical protein PF003_g601 [Phytophthora fragariae]KAE8939579.1 hypothetical protein PF009_g10585 [Phytophthora fragariae]KAE8999377.1 hypothetical protein PF011_g14658 [Phytophthora fragariae]KAE9099270.1 hypothetical protein PF007_g15941 [Phytophthora fragariae]KAE9100909.1 hypothetical protein PF010_g14637 [Phytophthora fragariae]